MDDSEEPQGEPVTASSRPAQPSEFLMRAREIVNQTLHRINAHLGGQRAAYEPVLKLVLESAEPMLPKLTSGQFLLVRGEKLEIVASTYETSDIYSMDVHKGVSGWVVENDKPALIPDLEDPSCHPAVTKYVRLFQGQRSEIAVPLHAGNRVFGVLNYENPEADAFTSEHLEILEFLAAGAATGVLVSEKQRQILRMSAVLAGSLRQAADVYEALLKTIQDLTGAEHAQVLSYTEGADFLEIVASTNREDFLRPKVDISESVCGTVVKTGRLQNVPDVGLLELSGGYDRRLGNDIGSELAAPVVVDGKVTNVLNVEARRVDYFSPADEDLLIALASFAAVVRSIEKVFENVLHDMKPPITHILEQVRQAFREGTGIESHRLNKIEHHANHLRTVVRLVTPGAYHLVPCNLESVLRPIALAQDPAFPILVDWDGIAKLPLVRADSSILSEVFSNLLENAVFELDEAKATSPLIEVCPIASGGLVGFSVKDNGRGIPEKVQPRVFHRYFTTKRPGKGTGVGLSFVYESLMRMGGKAGFETSPGAGTTFFAYCIPVTTISITMGGHGRHYKPHRIGIYRAGADRFAVAKEALESPDCVVIAIDDLNFVKNLADGEVCILILDPGSSKDVEQLIQELRVATTPQSNSASSSIQCFSWTPETGDQWLAVIREAFESPIPASG